MPQERLPKTYCPIKNTIAEALGRHRLSAYESSILWTVLRKTYGWATKEGTRKTEDKISLAQFQEATGLPKSHISRTIKLLVLRRIITQRGKFLGINKHTQEWNDLGRKDLLPNLPKGVKEFTQRGNKNLPKGVTLYIVKESKEKKEINIPQNGDSLKPQESPQVKAAMDQVVKQGFNIYAMVQKARIDLDQPKSWHFPDQVILNICTAYEREKGQIREPWPWFQTVLTQEWMNWNANNHERESNTAEKRAPAAKCVKEILQGIMK
jgi:phage replication O-like protein O